MNHQPYALTAQIARKRKEREDPPLVLNTNYSNKNCHIIRTKSAKPNTIIPNTTSLPKPNQQAEPVLSSSSGLLAGYMAHEFLTKGTLFGRKFEPARDGAVPLSSSSSGDPNKKPPSIKGNGIGGGSGGAGSGADTGAKGVEKTSYAELASLLKADGFHIPGIVNPTELARWIQM